VLQPPRDDRTDRSLDALREIGGTPFPTLQNRPDVFRVEIHLPGQHPPPDVVERKHSTNLRNSIFHRRYLRQKKSGRNRPASPTGEVKTISTASKTTIPHRSAGLLILEVVAEKPPDSDRKFPALPPLPRNIYVTGLQQGYDLKSTTNYL